MKTCPINYCTCKFLNCVVLDEILLNGSETFERMLKDVYIHVNVEGRKNDYMDEMGFLYSSHERLRTGFSKSSEQFYEFTNITCNNKNTIKMVQN